MKIAITGTTSGLDKALKDALFISHTVDVVKHILDTDIFEVVNIGLPE